MTFFEQEVFHLLLGGVVSLINQTSGCCLRRDVVRTFVDIVNQLESLGPVALTTLDEGFGLHEHHVAQTVDHPVGIFPGTTVTGNVDNTQSLETEAGTLANILRNRQTVAAGFHSFVSTAVIL